MRNFPKLLCSGLALVAIVMTIACGGAGEQQTSSEPPDTDLLVTDPSAALGASAERFVDQVESVEADFSFAFTIDGIEIGADGHFAYRAPESMHMTMEMSGVDGEMPAPSDIGPIEMLLIGDEIYMNTGFTGWMVMSLDELGEDAQSLREMMEAHAPFDFQTLVDGLGAQVENMGPVDVGGNTFTRLRINTDLATVLDAMMDSAGEDSLGAALFGVSGPMTMDILMNPETLLPYTFEANGDFGKLWRDDGRGCVINQLMLQQTGYTDETRTVPTNCLLVAVEARPPHNLLSAYPIERVPPGRPRC